MSIYILTDVETGGLDENKHSLLSVYAMAVDSNLNKLNDISLFVKPDDGLYHLDAEAMAVNNINIVEHNKKAKKESEIVNHFINFLNTYYGGEKFVFCGHNCDLDKRFLKKLFQKQNTNWNSWFSIRNLDTGSIAQFLRLTGDLPKDHSCSLKDLTKTYNVPYINAHEAKADVEMTLEVLKKMLSIKMKIEDDHSFSPPEIQKVDPFDLTTNLLFEKMGEV